MVLEKLTSSYEFIIFFLLHAGALIMSTIMSTVLNGVHAKLKVGEILLT